ncbi:MAG TPA: hypothetical protein VF893_04960 [Candidatus Bathyarchaeia archaeon]
MKNTLIILGALLSPIIACVILLIYLWTQVPMSLPLAILLWALVFGIFALVVCFAWLAGWLPRKKKS